MQDVCLKDVFMLFIIYSVFGWLMEVTLVSIRNKKLTPRGFLIGPWCPIYGWGGILIYLLLEKYHNDPIALFVMSFLIGSIVEYFTSYIMEKLFHARWWDYSDHKYNINGRISLETSLGFGALGTIAVYFVNPLIINLLNKIPSHIFLIMNIVIAILFITDSIVSLKLVSSIKNAKFQKFKDSTQKVDELVKEKLKETKLGKRLVNAFPNLKIKIDEIKKEIKEIK